MLEEEAVFTAALRNTTMELRGVASKLMAEIAREVSEHRRAFWRQRQRRELLVKGRISTTHHEYSGNEHERLEVNGSKEKKITKEFYTRAEFAEEYCDWELEIATLCISTRAYNESQRRLIRVYHRLIKCVDTMRHTRLSKEFGEHDDNRDYNIQDIKRVLSVFETAMLETNYGELSIPDEKIPDWIWNCANKAVLRHMQLAVVQAQSHHLRRRSELTYPLRLFLCG